MRILFIDDEPDHVEMVVRLVKEALDADVMVVSTVEEAVAALHDKLPGGVRAERLGDPLHGFPAYGRAASAPRPVGVPSLQPPHRHELSRSSGSPHIAEPRRG